MEWLPALVEGHPDLTLEEIGAEPTSAAAPPKSKQIRIGHLEKIAHPGRPHIPLTLSCPLLIGPVTFRSGAGGVFMPSCALLQGASLSNEPLKQRPRLSPRP
jgi:hypothetical protein